MAPCLDPNRTAAFAYLSWWRHGSAGVEISRELIGSSDIDGRSSELIKLKRRMTTRDIIQKTEARLARLPIAVCLIMRARNEGDNIIHFRLAEDWRAHRNGEEWLATVLSVHSSTFIDVGANVGEWTILFTCNRRRAKRGLLIDASSCAAARLIEGFAHNTALSVIHAAVADVPGEALFYEEPDAGMTSSLIKTFSVATAPPAKVR